MDVDTRKEVEESTEVLQEIADFVEDVLSSFPHKQIRTWTGPMRTTLKQKFTVLGLEYPDRQTHRQQPQLLAEASHSEDIHSSSESEDKCKKRTNAPFLSLDTNGSFNRLLFVMLILNPCRIVPPINAHRI